MTRLLKFFGLTTVLVVSFACSSFADGLQTRGRIADVDQVSMDRSWTTLYANVGLGLQMSNTQHDLRVDPVGSIFAFDMSDKSITVDGRLGADWQIPGTRWVIGGFVGYTDGDVSSSLSLLGGVVEAQMSINERFYGGGRLGYAWTNTQMTYVAYKYSRNEIEYTGILGPMSISASETVAGHSAMLGHEWRLNQFTRLAIEAEYKKLDNSDVLKAFDCMCGPVSLDRETDVLSAKVRFGFALN